MNDRVEMPRSPGPRHFDPSPAEFVFLQAVRQGADHFRAFINFDGVAVVEVAKNT